MVKRYPPEIKEKAAKMIIAGTSVAETARQLDVRPQTVRFWRSKIPVDLLPEKKQEPTVAAVFAAEWDAARFAILNPRGKKRKGGGAS